MTSLLSRFNASAWVPSQAYDLLSDNVPADVLYKGTDFESLNFMERWWVNWYLYWGNPVVATGVMSFLLHEFFYFGRCIPWMIVEQFDYFKQWKLQEAKSHSLAEQWKATKYVLKTHIMVELPLIWGFHPICEYFGMATHSVPFPSWQTIAYQVVIFFFFEDFFHYWAHRLMHHKALYKHVHKIHHEYSAPFGLAAEYAHPVEIIVLSMGTIGGPFLWCTWSKGNLHIATVYVWIILRLFQAVDAHSGYDFPWSLHNWFPLWAGADHHDYHHQAFLGCYSTSFRIWDHLFKTDTGYKALRAKQRDEKASKKVDSESKKTK
ncbi:putative ERG25-C-4 methyl sterol oxidase [Atractiella rhizophila]|nr:putative ERG25-C-4 methyl sterol oxidase [Atractiella rhizophila]